MKAYVLIKVRTGEVTSVVRHLHRVKAVRTAEMTFGEFDAIAIIEAGDLEAMGTVIAAQVQTIPGVLTTNTCLAVEVNGGG
ncbi:MAG: Lrp/AsnC ligand binding domain-containing protein [Anaerolineae bacterium]|nr:Lrp/AsnC ligand binding domain-containing protein [Anaerolineae bacterium]